MITKNGFVLVCESFEFTHNYCILAFSNSKEELEVNKPVNTDKRFFYIHKIVELDSIYNPAQIIK